MPPAVAPPTAARRRAASSRRRPTSAFAAAVSPSWRGTPRRARVRPSREASGGCDARDLAVGAERSRCGRAPARRAARRPGPGSRRPARSTLRGGLEADARLVARRELAQRAVAEVQRERRDGERQQHRGGAGGGEHRAAHDPRGPALPEADRALGAAARRRRPSPRAASRPTARRARARRRAGRRHQRRQQRRGREHRHRDDEDRAERHRAQRGRVDEPQAGERDDHGHAGEGDREPGRRQRVARAASGSRPALDLLAVAGEHEQRVVDGDADADHRRHVGHEDRHLGRPREQVDQRAGDVTRRRRARAAAPPRRASRRRRAG